MQSLPCKGETSLLKLNIKIRTNLKINFIKNSINYFLVSSFILSICCALNAQTWDETQTQLIKNISYFRTKIITKDTAKLIQLELLIERWDTEEKNKETLADIIFYIKDYDYVENSFKWVQKALARKFPQSPITASITEEKYLLVSDYTNLLDLITENVLHYKFPFQLKRDDDFIKEIKYYEIKQNQRIAEIGADSATFSFLLFFANPSLQISISELWDKISGVEYTLNHLSTFFDTQRIEVVKGKKKKLNWLVNLIKSLFAIPFIILKKWIK